MVIRLFVISFFIYITALIPRLYQLSSTAVYPDEITWMVKGKETIYALKNLNLDYFRHAWWNSTKDTYAIGIPLVVTNGLSHVALAGSGKYSLNLVSDIIASRLPIVIIGALTAPAIFYYFHPLVGTSALIAAIGYAINPVSIALDRWVLHDSFLTLFSFLAIAQYIKAIKTQKKTAFPGIYLGLATLTKPLGLIPSITWALMSFPRSKFTWQLLLKNIISFYLTIILLWPGSWINPITSLPKYLYNQVVLSRVGDPIPNFYLGSPTTNPNWTYYIFQILTRTPEVILFLCLFGVIISIAKTMHSRSPSREVIAISIYIFVSLCALSFASVKGGIRYLLPLMPWFYLLAALSLTNLTAYLKSNWQWFGTFTFFSLLLSPFFYAPNYYLYYNELINGPVNAARYDLVGLCFGNKEALEFIDKKKFPGTASVIGCSDTAPYHTSRKLTKSINDASLVILESSYVQQYPQTIKLLTNRDHIFSIFQSGVLTAKIFK